MIYWRFRTHSKVRCHSGRSSTAITSPPGRSWPCRCASVISSRGPPRQKIRDSPAGAAGSRMRRPRTRGSPRPPRQWRCGPAVALAIGRVARAAAAVTDLLCGRDDPSAPAARLVAAIVVASGSAGPTSPPRGRLAGSRRCRNRLTIWRDTIPSSAISGCPARARHVSARDVLLSAVHARRLFQSGPQPLSTGGSGRRRVAGRVVTTRSLSRGAARLRQTTDGTGYLD